jgi:cysteine synthase
VTAVGEMRATAPAVSSMDVRRRFGTETQVHDQETLESAIRHFRAAGIALPTFHELEEPAQISAGILDRLHGIPFNRAEPLNLFRLHWFNRPNVPRPTNVPAHIVLDQALTGVEAPIVVMLGDSFPMIAASKVLPAYACLVPRIVTGQLHPVHQRAVWPSTGNYCRGGVAVSKIMGCRGVAVLPANMSRERFEWLSKWVGNESDIIRTPGSESNVKEIYDACADLARDPRNVIINQFCEFGNALVHYRVTGRALRRLFDWLRADTEIHSMHSFVCATGSAGTLSAGDRLKEELGARIVAVEASECPTLLRNGFGEHNIQGIGDKHIPYIHNVFNTDDVVAVSDAATDELLYLVAHEEGRRYLVERRGVGVAQVDALAHIGLSGWANILASIRIAHAHQLDANQAVFTVAADGAALYDSERARILTARFRGSFEAIDAAETFARHILGAASIQHLETRREDRERMFNLGYFTWVEQQGVPVEVFEQRRRQRFWQELRGLTDVWDALIGDFNARAGLAG